jgi:hypothetical protein
MATERIGSKYNLKLAPGTAHASSERLFLLLFVGRSPFCTLNTPRLVDRAGERLSHLLDASVTRSAHIPRHSLDRAPILHRFYDVHDDAGVTLLRISPLPLI